MIIYIYIYREREREREREGERERERERCIYGFLRFFHMDFFSWDGSAYFS